MTLFQQMIVVFILYMCIYALVTRICQCVEHCATAKAFAKYQQSVIDKNIQGVEESVDNFGECLENFKAAEMVTEKRTGGWDEQK